MVVHYLYLVDSASVSSKLLLFLYDYIMFYIFLIFLFFIYLVFRILQDFSFKKSYRVDSVLYVFVVIFLWLLLLLRLLCFIYYYIYYIVVRDLWWVKYILQFWTLVRNYIETNAYLHRVIFFFFFLKKIFPKQMLLFFKKFCEIGLDRSVGMFNVMRYIIVWFFSSLKWWYFFLNWVFYIWDILIFNQIYLHIFMFGYKVIYVKNNYFNYISLGYSEWVKLFELEAAGVSEKFIYYCFNPVFLVGYGNFLMWHFGLYGRIFNNIPWSNKLYISSSVNVSLLLELVWTFIPTLILVLIAIPSFWILFCVDELINPLVTIKCIGNQWYWTYEYGGCGLRIDSYMVWPGEGRYGHLRLLEVDEWLRCPVRVPLRFIVTSSDVIHSWAVPAFGIKIDGIPGRLNQVSFYGTRTGFFFGQCSELCGVNHAFMPVMVEVVSVKDFVQYVRLRNLVE